MTPGSSRCGSWIQHNSPVSQLQTRRLVEVELHHGDLGAGYGPADSPAAFTAMELAEPMRSLRRDRLQRAPRTGSAKE